MTDSVDTAGTPLAGVMRAAVVTEFVAPLQVSELPLPTPGYGEALVKVESAGVCHTDLHAAHGDRPVSRDHRSRPDMR
jgi:propanol-preferring alcohol dehydrogenase